MGPKKKASAPQTPANEKTEKPTTPDAGADANDEEPQEDLKGTAAQANKDMAKVAGFLEQVGGATDEVGIGKGVSFINKQIQRQKITKAVREKEATRIQVTKEDIDFIVAELELSKMSAEKLLREHNGDLDAMLKAYILV
ncbi:hypothetical protein HDU96_006848 [Phlyctochytrium bullatum]|nr:hypothetical protein HDU96_006848 [Phlyctochytrium bullatum]